jgi:hypothetical protein
VCSSYLRAGGGRGWALLESLKSSADCANMDEKKMHH